MATLLMATVAAGALILAEPGAPVGAAATCADGGACALGDVGPGGGTVIFVKGVGAFNAQRSYADMSIDCVMYNMCNNNSVTAALTAEQQAALPFDYLEVAPASSQVGKVWTGGQSDVTGAASGLIGAGATNSAAIAAAFPGDDNAATYSLAYSNGSVDDWFLPSYDELSLVLIRQAVDGAQMGALSSNLWSSTQCCSSAARALNVPTGQPLWVTKNTNGVSVLPVRAFSAAVLPTTTTSTSTTSTTTAPTTTSISTTSTASSPTTEPATTATTTDAAVSTAISAPSSEAPLRAPLTETEVAEMAPGQLGVPSQLTAGQQLVLRNDGYVPGTTVEAYIASDPMLLGSGVADSLGAVAITVTLPTGLTGQHSIVLYVPNDNLGTRQLVQVGSAGTDGGLPATGAGLGATWPAAGLLLGGAVTVLIARRPRLRRTS